MNWDLTITKSGRSKGRRLFQPRVGQSKTKKLAMKEISADALKEGTRNYLPFEYLILAIHDYREIIIPIWFANFIGDDD